jgi:hypothetical protein
MHVFVRAANEENVSVRLVQPATKVAPVKEVSIPLLKLMAALIASRLYDHVKKTISLQSWTDSTLLLRG